MQSDGQIEPFQTDEIIVGEGQNVAEEIRSAAQERNCDAIVMAGRGESLLDTASLGRITKDVLKRSRLPVLVVPPIQ
jgi:nucleotide-binding universal stress UspA family protein